MKKTNSQSLILCVDIGNTSTTLGISRGSGIFRNSRLLTADLAQTGRVRAVVRQLFAKTGYAARDVTAVVVCSVVPQASAAIKKFWPTIFPQAKIIQLGKDIPFPIRNAYRVPTQVGNDRLANAVAAKYYYRLPAIIVDFGTAVTIDIVNADAEYIGGMIFPGLQTSLNALYAQTALLPRTELARPKDLIGRDTSSSILSGVVYATGFGVEGVLDALKKRVKPRPVIIGTGGHARFMKDIVCHLDVVDSLLTLKGIEKTYLESKYREK